MPSMPCSRRHWSLPFATIVEDPFSPHDAVADHGASDARVHSSRNRPSAEIASAIRGSRARAALASTSASLRRPALARSRARRARASADPGSSDRALVKSASASS